MKFKPQNPQSAIRNPQFDIVVIGTSLGGFDALKTILAGLPAGFSVPLVIVQHCSSNAEDLLCNILQEHSKLSVTEAEDKEIILGGHVYLAPPDYHLLVERGNFALSIEAPVAYSRPSIDVLFESAAEAYRERAIGIVLTGANEDGAKGAAKIKRYGGLVVVQEPKTAKAPAMPLAAIAAGAVDQIMPLEEIGPFIAKMANKGDVK